MCDGMGTAYDYLQCDPEDINTKVELQGIVCPKCQGSGYALYFEEDEKKEHFVKIRERRIKALDNPTAFKSPKLF